MLDGNDVQVILLADIEILDADAHHALSRGNLLDLHLVVQEDEIQEVVGDEALSETQSHITLRVDDLRAELGQNGSLILADGLGDDMRHAQADDVQGGQDAGIDPLPDADDRCVAVLDTHLCQGLLRQVLSHKGVLRILAELPHLILIAVHDDDVLSGFRQTDGQGGSETAKADDAE